MLESIYNNLRLIGYKINELPNGCFITERPDSMKTLFDRQGNILITNCREIVPVSSIYYHAIDNKGNDILLNLEGELVDGGEGCEIHTERQYIQVMYWNGYKLEKNNVYESQGKVIFKNVTQSVQYIRLHNGEYSLISTDAEHNLGSLDRNNKYTPIPIKVKYFPSLNNHYIHYNDSHLFSAGIVTDYDGNRIDTDNSSGEFIVNIDTTSMQSSNYIVTEKDTNKVSIINKDKQIIKSLYVEDTIEADFTSEPNVISIKTSHSSEYLLNIATEKRSQEYKSIYKNDFIGERFMGDCIGIVLIDRHTLQPIANVDNISDWYFQGNIIGTSRKVNNEYVPQHYTLDFKELFTEFEFNV